jgi:hypothetical protein
MTAGDAKKSNGQLLAAAMKGMQDGVCAPLGLCFDKAEGGGVLLPRLVQFRDSLTAHAGQRLAWATERVAAQGREFKHDEEALRDGHVRTVEGRSKAKAGQLLVSADGKAEGDGSEKNSGLSLAEFDAAMRDSVGEERALLELALESNGSVVDRVEELGAELQQGESAKALLQRRSSEYMSHVTAALARSQEAALRLLQSYSERAETDGSFLDELLDSVGNGEGGAGDGMGEDGVGAVAASGTSGGVAGVVSTAASEANALVNSRLRRWTIPTASSIALTEAIGRGVQQLHSQLYAMAAARLAARVGAWEQESRALYEACFVSPMRLLLQAEGGLPEAELGEKHEQQVSEAEERLLKRVAHILGASAENGPEGTEGVSEGVSAASETSLDGEAGGPVVRTTATAATAQAQAQAVVDAALARFRFDASAAFSALTTDNENALAALAESIVTAAATRLKADVDEWWAIALAADKLPLVKKGASEGGQDGEEGVGGAVGNALAPMVRQARGTLQLELQNSPIGATTARGLRVSKLDASIILWSLSFHAICSTTPTLVLFADA